MTLLYDQKYFEEQHLKLQQEMQRFQHTVQAWEDLTQVLPRVLSAVERLERRAQEALGQVEREVERQKAQFERYQQQQMQHLKNTVDGVLEQASKLSDQGLLLQLQQQLLQLSHQQGELQGNMQQDLKNFEVQVVGPLQQQVKDLQRGLEDTEGQQQHLQAQVVHLENQGNERASEQAKWQQGLSEQLNDLERRLEGQAEAQVQGQQHFQALLGQEAEQRQQLHVQHLQLQRQLEALEGRHTQLEQSNMATQKDLERFKASCTDHQGQEQSRWQTWQQPFLLHVQDLQSQLKNTQRDHQNLASLQAAQGSTLRGMVDQVHGEVLKQLHTLQQEASSKNDTLSRDLRHAQEKWGRELKVVSQNLSDFKAWFLDAKPLVRVFSKPS